MLKWVQFHNVLQNIKKKDKDKKNYTESPSLHVNTTS